MWDKLETTYLCDHSDTSDHDGRAAHWYALERPGNMRYADPLPLVLDGGTGFLKVGYAAQVCSGLIVQSWVRRS